MDLIEEVRQLNIEIRCALHYLEEERSDTAYEYLKQAEERGMNLWHKIEKAL